MSDIFISYKREERAKAKLLADSLQNQGWSVWWDPNLRAGERFDSVIEKALNDAKCVIVLWSRLSVVSEYVKDEAAYALNQGKLLPVAIESVELPFRFQGLHTIKIENWDGSASAAVFQDLVHDLSSLVGRRNAEHVATEKPEKRSTAGETDPETPVRSVNTRGVAPLEREVAVLAPSVFTTLGWTAGWAIGWGLGGAMGWDSGSTGDWNIGGGTAGAFAGGVGWAATDRALCQANAHASKFPLKNIGFAWVVSGFIGGAVGWAVGWAIAGALGGLATAYFFGLTESTDRVKVAAIFVVIWSLAWAAGGTIGWDIGFEAARAFGWGKSRALGWALGGAAGGAIVGIASSCWLVWWSRRLGREA